MTSLSASNETLRVGIFEYGTCDVGRSFGADARRSLGASTRGRSGASERPLGTRFPVAVPTEKAKAAVTAATETNTIFTLSSPRYNRRLLPLILMALENHHRQSIPPPGHPASLWCPFI